jgi:hypothetical protein
MTGGSPRSNLIAANTEKRKLLRPASLLFSAVTICDS